jgi:dihydrofolate reductase
MRANGARLDNLSQLTAVIPTRRPTVIRAIAAVDDQLGLSTDTGIPWSIPADVAHFRSETASADVLMGYATYEEYARPMPGGTNYVATGRTELLRTGFAPVADAVTFLQQRGLADIWNIGGASLFAATLSLVQEIHLTRIAGAYDCTKFFPPFGAEFGLVSEEATAASGDTPAFAFQVWRRSEAHPSS